MRFIMDLTQLPGSIASKLAGHEAHGAASVERGKVSTVTLVARNIPGASWGSVVADSRGIFVLFFDKSSNLIGRGVDVMSMEDGGSVLLNGPVVEAPVVVSV